MPASQATPASRRRLNVQAQLGREVSAYGEACRMVERGEVTQQLVDRKRECVRQRINELVEAVETETEERIV